MMMPEEKDRTVHAMDQMRIGAFISQLRKENNMTQKELAEKLGITRPGRLQMGERQRYARGFPDEAVV